MERKTETVITRGRRERREKEGGVEESYEKVKKIIKRGRERE